MKNLAVALLMSFSLVGLVACAQLVTTQAPVETAKVKTTKVSKVKKSKRPAAVVTKRKPSKGAIVVRPKPKPKPVVQPVGGEGGSEGGSSGWG